LDTYRSGKGRGGGARGGPQNLCGRRAWLVFIKISAKEGPALPAEGRVLMLLDLGFCVSPAVWAPKRWVGKVFARQLARRRPPPIMQALLSLGQAMVRPSFPVLLIEQGTLLTRLPISSTRRPPEAIAKRNAPFARPHQIWHGPSVCGRIAEVRATVTAAALELIENAYWPKRDRARFSGGPPSFERHRANLSPRSGGIRCWCWRSAPAADPRAAAGRQIIGYGWRIRWVATAMAEAGRTARERSRPRQPRSLHGEHRRRFFARRTTMSGWWASAAPGPVTGRLDPWRRFCCSGQSGTVRLTGRWL